MILEVIIKLYKTNCVYAIEDEKGVFLYRRNSVSKLSMTVKCRKTKCMIFYAGAYLQVFTCFSGLSAISLCQAELKSEC